MSTKAVVALQYRQIIERATELGMKAERPNEGWLRTVRKALQMSGAQLARRLGVTRALISQSESAELTGRVTLKKMREMAEAMNCRFVYAVVPKTTIQDTIAAQAEKKARTYVKKTSEHMALEGQALSQMQIDYEVERLALGMTESPPRDLWEAE